MINVSTRLSSSWAKLVYNWGECYTYPAEGAPNIDTVRFELFKEEDRMDGWEDDKILVHVNPDDRIFLFKMNQKTQFIETWQNSVQVAQLTLGDLNTTMMNLIEFRLGWESRDYFKEVVLPAALITPSVVKASKKAWWAKIKETGLLFIYASKQQVDKENGTFVQIPVEQIPLLWSIPELPVDFWIENKIIHVEAHHLHSLADVLNSLDREPALFTLPAGVISATLLTDTTFNLVHDDRLNWGQRLLGRFNGFNIVLDNDDITDYKYPENDQHFTNLYPAF